MARRDYDVKLRLLMGAMAGMWRGDMRMQAEQARQSPVPVDLFAVDSESSESPDVQSWRVESAAEAHVSD